MDIIMPPALLPRPSSCSSLSVRPPALNAAVVNGVIAPALGGSARAPIGVDVLVPPGSWWGVTIPAPSCIPGFGLRLHSHRTSPSTSRRWKFRWQSQAAHRSAPTVPSWPPGINSPQPSRACPPMLAAWFFWHSRYRKAPFFTFDSFADADSEAAPATCTA